MRGNSCRSYLSPSVNKAGTGQRAGVVSWLVTASRAQSRDQLDEERTTADGSSMWPRFTIDLRMNSEPLSLRLKSLVAADDAEWIGVECSRDHRLRCDIVYTEPPRTERNGHYVHRAPIAARSPYRRTLFLDGDTICVGSIDEILARDDVDLCATRFAGWDTVTPPVSCRGKEWLSLPDSQVLDTTLHALANAALQAHPAINTGVLAYGAACPAIEAWPRLTSLGRSCCLSDELAMQLLLTRITHRTVDQRFNCSPIYAPNTDDVRIWHFHGGRHLESRFSRSLWMPYFKQCFDSNIANIRTWWRLADPSLRAI